MNQNTCSFPGGNPLKLTSVVVLLSLILWVAVTNRAETKADTVQEPALSCKIENAEPESPRFYRVTNLEHLRFQVVLETNGLPLDKLSLTPRQSNSLDAPSLSVKLELRSLDEPGIDIPVRLRPVGSTGDLGTDSIISILELPISETKIRAGFERFFQRAIASLDLNDPEQAAQARTMTERKEKTFTYIRRFHYENRQGLYELRCSYKSSKEGNWNGEVIAEPILLNIEYEMSFFDQEALQP